MVCDQLAEFSLRLTNGLATLKRSLTGFEQRRGLTPLSKREEMTLNASFNEFVSQ